MPIDLWVKFLPWGISDGKKLIPTQLDFSRFENGIEKDPTRQTIESSKKGRAWRSTEEKQANKSFIDSRFYLHGIYAA